ncbi:MAG TPA: AI-2E family transporter [Polyangiaceae bacterium]|jgi:predicted PurR-regulated permease PerM|nr:AI-2E family transporter [Polyangiaceae bacterium]
MPDRSQQRRVDVHIQLPTRTIVKGLLGALLVWAVLRVWPEVVFLGISLLLAIALEPFVAWVGGRGLSRVGCVALIAIVWLGLIGLGVGLVLPPLGEQLAELAANFPEFRARVEHRLAPSNWILRTIIEQMFELPSSPELTAHFNTPLIWGRIAVSTFMTTFFVIVTTLYLLIDGKRLYAWLLAYVPRRHREKMAETVSCVSVVVHAYVRGQVTTCLLFFGFSAAVLGAMRVPAVLPLALLAGICDVVPVVGIIVATVPAVLLALTVSPSAASIVLLSYGLYHLLETYYVVPRFYGSSLRLSTLAVLLALIVGGTLQGVIGSVLVLPLVAAYPIVERVWLKDYLAREVLADHTALARAAETGSEEVVDAVLQGEKHVGEPREDAGT